MLHHYRTSTDGHIIPHFGPIADHGPRPDETPCTDLGIAGQGRVGGNMTVVTDLRIVFNHRSAVDDHIKAQLSAAVDHRTGQHHCSWAQHGARRDKGGRRLDLCGRCRHTERP